MKMCCNIFLVVRTASSRLPRKALLRIKNKPLIKILLGRIRIKKVKKIVICTTNQKTDDKLVRLLQDCNVKIFRGDENNVLYRIYEAARKYKISKFVVVEGDDLFCDPDLIQKTWDLLSKTDYEFIVWNGLPFGVSPTGIKTKKLKMLIENSVINSDTGWGEFIINSGYFKVGKLTPDNQKLLRPEIRLSVDYPEDFNLAKKIISKLPNKFCLEDIIDLFDTNPQLLKINASVKKKYELNFKKKMIKVLGPKMGGPR
ncbi:MAG: NTP transferase domain-containing protein [Nitrosopumilaceae archaeon]